MKHKDIEVGDRILFILGMSLCGVLVFTLLTGVVVALFTPLRKREKTSSVQGESQDFSADAHGFRSFAGNYAEAVKKGGAVVTKQEITQALEDHDQSTEIFLDKLWKSIKKGGICAGKEIILIVMKMVERSI
ncbi:hypothetical protein JCM21714_3050 [Gracilibacillus boraciitolerans JCM 21714]|uniref:Uncharacterized protein n=1 Tax=Gracilibacillus boraciitolerans JCM 21714 TaxID=1298598 RepID=W4VMI2_9BACI|nr:hypothetical protein [Gracilibacillus boraciitolerans]GAE93929.1 hypothetical protein JCM21714_3050 [Gracilibacillus boraciitolerans JCM 21714]